MRSLIDLNTYPLDAPGTHRWHRLVEEARADLTRDGVFSLPDFIRADALAPLLAHIKPRLQSEAFRHARRHTIYFRDDMPGLPDTHPARTPLETVIHTLCSDQLRDTGLWPLYHEAGLRDFLAAVMGMPALYPMDDPLAGLNVMGYGAGDALNWHFDRSAFTTTLLLQEPESGGAFEYVRDLRSDDSPNYDAVGALLDGALKPAVLPLSAGTLNVFKGQNTAHRVSPVEGSRARIICVLSYFDRPGVAFTETERLGFYGRTGSP